MKAKPLKGQCGQPTTTGWKTMDEPATRQPKHTNTGITIENGMPAEMAAEHCAGNGRNRKERTTKLTNCYTGTGNDTKLLLHNVFFRSFSPAKADKKPKGNGIKDGFCAAGFVFMPESFGFLVGLMCGCLP